ncbi:MAG: hypothetical protein WB562_03230 [Candidatus Sulfotelmatobacter sp.]
MKDFLLVTFLLFFIGIYIVGNNCLVFAANVPSFHFFPPTTTHNKLTSSSGFTFINQSQLRFQPWGRSNNLTIEPITNSSFQEFKFIGVTGNSSSGFVSQDLNYSGKKVTVSLKSVSKSSVGLNNIDPQISFTFTITGGNGHTALLTDVVGPLRISGWHTDHLYQSLSPGSDGTINLEGLTSHDVHYLKKIVITVQRESRIKNAEFGLKLE